MGCHCRLRFLLEKNLIGKLLTIFQQSGMICSFVDWGWFWSISGHCLNRQVTRVLLGGIKVYKQFIILESESCQYVYVECGDSAHRVCSTFQILMQHLLEIVENSFIKSEYFAEYLKLTVGISNVHTLINSCLRRVLIYRWRWSKKDDIKRKNHQLVSKSRQRVVRDQVGEEGVQVQPHL